MLNEMDPAMPSIFGINSRELFEVAYGLPREQRLTKMFMIAITQRYDPVLAGFEFM